MTEVHHGLGRRLLLAKKHFTKDILSLAHRLKIDKSSQELLVHVRRILKSDPRLALIIAFNHVSLPDPWFIYRVYNQYLDSERARDLYVLGSNWNLNPKNNPKFADAAEVGAELLNCNFIPTIQTYMIQTPEAMSYWGYTEYDIRENRKLVLSSLNEMRDGNHPHGITLVIAPEGTRSPDGTLQHGDESVRGIVKRLNPALFVPMGIVYLSGFDRGINLGKSVQINIGEPLDISSGRVPRHETIMTSIAKLLPPKLQGQWQRLV